MAKKRGKCEGKRTQMRAMMQSPKNMSELKLRNSSFNDLEDEVRISTRSQSSSSGMPQSMEEHEKAHGFKLQDAKLLSQCIGKSAICSS